MDPTSATGCDGVFSANRTMSGLDLPADTADKLRQDTQGLNMVAAATAAKTVAARLKQQGISVTAAAANPTLITSAFSAAKTPLAQVSASTGSYTSTAVLAALLYPIWDSRAANNSARNWVSPVKDQGNCGSCVAFAAAAAAETSVAAASGLSSNNLDFSEEWLFFCNGLYNPTCNTGWDAGQACDVLAKKSIPPEGTYPYKQAKACSPTNVADVRPSGTFSFKQINDLDQAKEHIRTYGSVLTYFAVYNDFFNWKATSPPYVWDGKSALAGYHQVLCVGYNDTGLYWIAKNSWNTNWGDKGFFRMSYTNRAGFMSASGDNIMGLMFAAKNKSPPPSPQPPSPLLRRPPPPGKMFPPPVGKKFPPPPSPPSPRPPSPAPPAPRCGDGRCSGIENCALCPQDCGACARCGDGVCSGGETCRTCPQDCFSSKLPNGTYSCCGDGVCSPGDGETCTSCAKDCGTCAQCNNNGICESVRYNETCFNTATKLGCKDCGTCGGPVCGDGVCTFSLVGYSENCVSCSKDCGKCTDDKFCGDGVCSSSRNEDPDTCSRDCHGAPPPADEPNSEPPADQHPPDGSSAPPPYSYYDYGNDYSNYWDKGHK